MYLNDLDYFVKHRLRCPAYVRYADDFILFDDDKAKLRGWRADILAFLQTLRLRLHETRAARTATGTTLTTRTTTGDFVAPAGLTNAQMPRLHAFAAPV